MKRLRETQESQKPKDVEDGSKSKRRRSQSPIHAIEQPSEQQQVAHALGAMADPKYKPVGRDQTPAGDGNQASSSLPTRTQLEKTLQRPEHAIVSQKIDRKLEGFENTKAAFNIDNINIELLRNTTKNTSLMDYASTVQFYKAYPDFNLVTKNDALEAVKNIERQAGPMNMVTLQNEFRRLDMAYDRHLIDQAGENPYRK